MKYIIYIKYASLAALLLHFTLYINAQDYSTPQSIELMKARSLWFNTGNGAGLVLDELTSYGSLEANYNIEKGSFKRVQEGQRENRLGVYTEGGVQLGEAYAWGEFNYNNTTSHDSRFNTAMLNPFRGIPYYPADPNISEWRKQDYNLRMKAASKPLLGRYILGIQAEYVTQAGAKQIDPRSEVYYYHLDIKPGVATRFGIHQLGLNIAYRNMIQETRGHTNSDTQVNQDLYVVKGLGNHYTAVIGGLQSLGSFHYKSNLLGAELQYGLNLPEVKLLFNGGYNYSVEDVVRDISKPRKEGSLALNTLFANIGVVKEGDNLQRLDISYSANRANGIEYVQVLDNTYEVQQWVDVYSSIRSTYSSDNLNIKYDFYRGANNDYFWKAGAVAGYVSQNDLYIMPESNMDIENMYFGVNGLINFEVGKSGKISLGADFVYNNNLEGEYNYGGASPDSEVITDFLIPDFNYLSSDFYKLGGTISYFTGISNTTGLYVKLTADLYKPTEGDTKRGVGSVGLGFTF